MNTTTSPEQAVAELVQHWSKAELDGASSALGELLTGDFIGVGPRGYLRTHNQWLARYSSGAVHTTAFNLSELNLRVFGDTAVVVAAQTQRSTNNVRRCQRCVPLLTDRRAAERPVAPCRLARQPQRRPTGRGGTSPPWAGTGARLARHPLHRPRPPGTNAAGCGGGPPPRQSTRTAVLAPSILCTTPLRPGPRTRHPLLAHQPARTTDLFMPPSSLWCRLHRARPRAEGRHLPGQCPTALPRIQEADAKILTMHGPTLCRRQSPLPFQQVSNPGGAVPPADEEPAGELLPEEASLLLRARRMAPGPGSCLAGAFRSARRCRALADAVHSCLDCSMRGWPAPGRRPGTSAAFMIGGPAPPGRAQLPGAGGGEAVAFGCVKRTGRGAW
ncbi:nuclear transport factor 2 family protein [Streptomyces caniferus]|uniref:nuclear transport factor 2 family protein n=1 Tax=Streptomyces caniferus TaxID=285557 RepID=UPI0037124299